MFNKVKNYLRTDMKYVAMAFAYMNGSDILSFID